MAALNDRSGLPRLRRRLGGPPARSGLRPGQFDPAALDVEGAFAKRMRLHSLTVEHREDSARLEPGNAAPAQLDPAALDVEGAFAERVRFRSSSLEHREKSKRIAVENAAPARLDPVVLEIEGTLGERVVFRLRIEHREM
jgi:hypothetical protein